MPSPGSAGAWGCCCSTSASATAVAELGGNLFLLLPLGLLPPVAARKDPGWRAMLTLGVVASVAIEAVQWGFALAVAAIDDVMLNTAGVALGYAAYRLSRRLTGAPSSRQRPADC